MMKWRGRTRSWLLCLLGMTLWLLFGCVAPDGSLIRFEQAPDGTISGWQLDESSVDISAAQHATSYPSRPILYYDGIQSIRAVERDGTDLGTVGEGLFPSLSHQGDRFAYLRYNEGDGRLNHLVVASLSQREQTVLQPSTLGTPELVFGSRQFAWSPDDIQIAFIEIGTIATPGNRITIVNTGSGQIEYELMVTREVTWTAEAIFQFVFADHDIRLTEILPTIAWSPDGQKLLLSSMNLVVIDIKSGVRETVVSPLPSSECIVWSAWLPASDGLVYASHCIHNGENLLPPQLWRIGLDDEEAMPLLTPKQLLQLGFNASDYFAFEVSPNGNYLALLGVSAANDVYSAPHSRLLILDFATMVTEPIHNSAPQPLAQWDLPGINGSLVWGPDEQEVAFFRAFKTGTIEVMSWKEGLSRTVGEVALIPDWKPQPLLNGLSFGLTVVSWTP